jgi:hypothetical protein
MPLNFTPPDCVLHVPIISSVILRISLTPIFCNRTSDPVTGKGNFKTDLEEIGWLWIGLI